MLSVGVRLCTVFELNERHSGTEKARTAPTAYPNKPGGGPVHVSCCALAFSYTPQMNTRNLKPETPKEIRQPSMANTSERKVRKTVKQSSVA